MMIWYEMLFLVVVGFGLGFVCALFYSARDERRLWRQHLDWLTKNYARQHAFLDSLFSDHKEEESHASREGTD